MKRVAVLVSGGGTNLQALLESERRGENPNGKIELVVASKPGVYALERAANFGVESAVVSRRDYADSAAFDAALLDTLQKHSIDVVVLAGFLSVLGEKVIAAYRNKIIKKQKNSSRKIYNISITEFLILFYEISINVYRFHSIII